MAMNRTVACRACSAPMIFLETATGKSIPINADTVEGDERRYDSKRHVSHFATCPSAQKFRQPRR